MRNLPFLWDLLKFQLTSCNFCKHHIFIICRTEFSSPSNSNEEHELTLRTNDKNEQCFDTAEIRMRKEFNPSANENPLQFNATLIPVEKNSNFDGKLGRLAKKVIGAKYLGFFLLSFPQDEIKCISFAQLVLLILYIFWGKCVYFSFFEWLFHNYVKNP